MNGLPLVVAFLPILIAAFLLGIVFIVVFKKYWPFRSAAGLVGRLFLLPFFALSTFANVLLCLVMWFATGSSFAIVPEKSHIEKTSRFR